MKIELINSRGWSAALFGVGLSYGLTSLYESWDDSPEDVQSRVKSVASKLCRLGGGEDKFLRQIMYWWDANFPRFLWQEVDQYRIGVTTQSESTMHTIMHRSLGQDDFEEEISMHTLGRLNGYIEAYKLVKNNITAFLKLKNELPEGFLQRRVWSLSLANMKNIYHQRKNHRLPQWHTICEAFVDETPTWLRGIYE